MTNDTRSAESLLADTAWLKRMARGLVRGEDACEDLSQEAALVALLHSRAGKPVTRPWLFGVLRNRAMRHHRVERDRSRHEEVIARPEVDSQAHLMIEQVEIQRKTVDAVMSLSEPYRSTVLYRYWESLSTVEIAKRSKVPVETARTRLKRGIIMLRERLDKSCGSRAAWLAPVGGWIGIKPAVPVLIAGAAKAGLAFGAVAAVVTVASLLWTDDLPPPEISGRFVARENDADAKRRAVALAQPAEPMRQAAQLAVKGEPPRPVEPPVLRGPTPRLEAGFEDLILALRAIHSAELRWQADARLDTDDNAVGEFAFLPELLGAKVERPGFGPSSVLPALRSTQIKKAATRYRFEVYLPSADGFGTTRDGSSMPEARLAEQFWCAYAWPKEFSSSEQLPVFFIDHSGQILFSENLGGQYSGLMQPNSNAAYSKEDLGRVGDKVAISRRDQKVSSHDSQFWFLARLPAPTELVVDLAKPLGAPLGRNLIVDVRAIPVEELNRYGADFRARVMRQREGLRGTSLWQKTPRIPIGQASYMWGVAKLKLIGWPSNDAVIILSSTVRRIPRILIPSRFEFDSKRLRIELDARDAWLPSGEWEGERVIAALDTLADAQVEFRSRKIVDLDRDGVAEFGFLHDLAGEFFGKPGILQGFESGRSHDGRVYEVFNRCGYSFVVYLIDESGKPVRGGVGGKGPGQVSRRTFVAETGWCCYAWPNTSTAESTPVFYTDHRGFTYRSDNTLGQKVVYRGRSKSPLPLAILPPGVSGLDAFVTGLALSAENGGEVVGRDGLTWSRIR